MAVEIIALDARRFGEWRAPVFETFRAGFAMSGEDAARFAERVVDRHAGRVSFRCVLAREGVDGSFLGCAYGYTGGPGQWWRDIVAGAVGGRVAGRWLADYFEFVEFAVVPGARRRGVGGRIHDALLSGLLHRTAALSTQRDNDAARRFYARRGWELLLEGLVFPNGTEPYIVMGLDLRRRGPTIGRDGA